MTNVNQVIGPAEATTTLLVLWQAQAPDFRLYVPVGRLVVRRYGARSVYDFLYVRGLVRARSLGFQPFLAFPRTDLVYRSDSLFPFFRNRVLTATRPDFDRYVHALGLVRATATDINLLGRGQGRRETDRVEVVLVPGQEKPGDPYTTTFWLRGVRHVEGAESAVATLAHGERFGCIPEPGNVVNARAMLLTTSDGRRIGYVPDYLLTDLAKLQEASDAVAITVERLNPPPAPSAQRILCRITAPWPAGFVPFVDDEFHPLVEAPPPEAELPASA